MARMLGQHLDKAVHLALSMECPARRFLAAGARYLPDIRPLEAQARKRCRPAIRP